MRNIKTNIIVFLFILIFINISFLYAKDHGELDLSIEVDVPQETYLPKIYYNGSHLSQNRKVVDTNNRPFDITQDGETKNFTIRIEGNEGSGKTLEVKIDGAFFTLSETGKASEKSNVFAYPVLIEHESTNFLQEKYIIYSMKIPFGPHTDKNDILEKQFKIIWKGNSQVPYGTYTCSIEVNYTIL